MPILFGTEVDKRSKWLGKDVCFKYADTIAYFTVGKVTIDEVEKEMVRGRTGTKKITWLWPKKGSHGVYSFVGYDVTACRVMSREKFEIVRLLHYL